MGKKWIYRLKKEDFAHVAQKLNVALEGRLDDMRKALSEYYSETENDPQLFDIWAELEATYHDGAGPSITFTNAKGDHLVARLSIDNMQKEAHKRESSQDRKTAALTRDQASRTMQRSLNRSANGRSGSTGRKNHLDLDMIPRALPDSLKGRALKWFIANNKQ